MKMRPKLLIGIAFTMGFGAGVGFSLAFLCGLRNHMLAEISRAMEASEEENEEYEMPEWLTKAHADIKKATELAKVSNDQV